MIDFKEGSKLIIKTECDIEFSIVVLREAEDGRFLRCIGIGENLQESNMFISCGNNELVDIDSDIVYKIKSIKELKVSSEVMRERLALV